jgi:hypothetical protein
MEKYVCAWRTRRGGSYKTSQLLRLRRYRRNVNGQHGIGPILIIAPINAEKYMQAK